MFRTILFFSFNLIVLFSFLPDLGVVGSPEEAGKPPVIGHNAPENVDIGANKNEQADKVEKGPLNVIPLPNGNFNTGGENKKPVEYNVENNVEGNIKGEGNTKGEAQVGKPDNARGNVENVRENVENTRGNVENARGNVENAQEKVRGNVENAQEKVQNAQEKMENGQVAVDKGQGKVKNGQETPQDKVGNNVPDKGKNVFNNNINTPRNNSEKPAGNKNAGNEVSDVKNNVNGENVKNHVKGTGNVIPPKVEDDVVQSGALLRGFYVFLGMSAILMVYFLIKSYRLRKGGQKSQHVRKYGVRARREDVEMLPLPLDEEDDDDTVFDVGNHTLR